MAKKYVRRIRTISESIEIVETGYDIDYIKRNNAQLVVKRHRMPNTEKIEEVEGWRDITPVEEALLGVPVTTTRVALPSER